MTLFLRNLQTGQIKKVEPDTAEFEKLKSERHDNLPVWEQTGPHDADPKTFAASYEVEKRGEHDVPIADVTTDGVAKSAKSAEKLGQDAPVSDS